MALHELRLFFLFIFFTRRARPPCKSLLQVIRICPEEATEAPVANRYRRAENNTKLNTQLEDDS